MKEIEYTVHLSNLRDNCCNGDHTTKNSKNGDPTIKEGKKIRETKQREPLILIGEKPCEFFLEVSTELFQGCLLTLPTGSSKGGMKDQLLQVDVRPF